MQPLTTMGVAGDSCCARTSWSRATARRLTSRSWSVEYPSLVPQSALAPLELLREQAPDALPGEQRQQGRAEIAVGQLRALLEVAQLVERPRSVRVMIGVAGKADQRVEREPRVGVPRVDRPHAPG